MAASLAIMAAMQVAIAIVALKAVRELSASIAELRREVRPLVEKANRIADDAQRMTALALAQVERVEQLLTSTIARVEETLGIVQGAIVQPVRQGAAIVAAIRAAFGVFRSVRDARQHAGRDDEEPLFVG
jgi:hypothetical protein